MQRFNLLYIIWSLEPGGAERMVAELALNCDRRRFRPQVLCLNQPGALAEELKHRSVKVMTLNKSKKIELAVIPKIMRIIRENKVDIVHTHLWGANLWGRIAAYLAKVPVIVATEHSVELWKNPIHFCADRILSFLSDKVIAVSEKVKDFYQNRVGISARKLMTVYNGVRTESFTGLKDRTYNYSDFGLKNDYPLWAVIGRLVPVKNHHSLIEAAALLNKMGSPINLLIVGSGMLRDELMKKAAEMNLSGQICFTGLRSDINEILHSVNGVVLASEREGLPVVLLEAMAAGRPVVSTRVGGVPELIKNRENGLLIDHGAPEEIAGAIKEINLNIALADKLGAAARRTIKDNFGLDKMIAGYQSLYEDIMNAKKIKVLIVVDNFGCGGAQRQIIEYGRHYDRERFDLTVLSLSRDRNELLGELKGLGITTKTVNQYGKFSPPALFELYNFIRRGKYDIVNTYLFTADCYGRIAAYLAGVPVVVASLRSPDLWKKVPHYLADWCLKFGTSRYIVNARVIKDILRHKTKVPCRRIDIVYNGVSRDGSQVTKSKDQIKEELGIARGTKLAGIVGRLGPEKNHRMFLKMAAEVLKQNKDVNFVIVGDGTLREELEKKAESLGISKEVIFTGNRTDVNDILNALDVFCLTSRYEGCSNVILEAMAMGKPVVATNVGGNPELVEDGKTGFVVSDNDYKKMAGAVEFLVSDQELAGQMGKAGEEKVSRQFLSPRMAREIDSIYEDLYRKKVRVRQCVR